MNRSVSASMTSTEFSWLFDAYHQNLPGEFINDVQHTVGPPVRRPVLDEVIGPDMVRP